VRIALVSPYSYTYPGGVGRHVEALTQRFLAAGHDARLLAPYDPDDRHARLTHRGARPQARPAPDYLVPLGRSVAIPMNGAMSNLSVTPTGVALLERELRHGGYDVVHVHEPNAPVLSWFATEAGLLPAVATFHTYADSFASRFGAGFIGMRRMYNKLHVRIAVSEAARWTAEHFCGGRYRIVPNGVDLGAAPRGPKPVPSDVLRVVFVGRAEERKGLPVLLRAFEALRGAGVKARLTLAGVSRDEVAPYLLDAAGVDARGRVDEAEKWRLVHEADVLCAPSLGGESFGMVMTEAFAAGTPVVCSDIAGYRDVVRAGVDGLLVPPGDPAALGQALHALARDPARRARMSLAAREHAERYGWETVAGEVMECYEEAIELAAAAPPARLGLRAADGMPVRPPVRRDPLEPPARAGGRRRAALAAGAVAVAGLGVLALGQIGLDSVTAALVGAAPLWVLVAFALMCGSMLIRAEAWHAILRAALPDVPVRRGDVARGVMIGVLMSATLPARLGEPSRALIVARRLGRVRERLPLVLGTIVSQTLLNIVALVILGTVVLATVGLFRGGEHALVAAALVPVVLVALVALLPALLRGARARGTVVQMRQGLGVFRRPRLGAWAALAQLTAWAVQWFACYALLVALGLDHVGVGAAAAVLFAINVTSAVPLTPSNVGVFQAACVAVLSAYGVAQTDALAYGIILQAVEIATAFAMGMPALVREGLSWRDMRLRALHAAPVELAVARPAEAR
jgi:phosphatidylinositol alpha-mannosyltransferase